jgi:hypothetical protein
MKKSKKLFSIVITSIFITLLFSCGEGNISKSSTPGDVVKAMMEYSVDENIDGFISIMASNNGEEFDEKDIEVLKAIMYLYKEEFDKKEGFKEVIIIEEKISEDGKTATVTSQLLYGNGEKSKNGDIYLVNENGTWKLRLK